MVTLRCQDCGRTQEGKKKDIEEDSCNECEGSFEIKGSEDDAYEPITCLDCDKEIPGNEDTYTCDGCDGEGLCIDCVLDLEGVNVCKKCVDKHYPRKIETKIEYKEKVVEKPVKIFVDKQGTPIDTSFNPFSKSKFD